MAINPRAIAMEGVGQSPIQFALGGWLGELLDVPEVELPSVLRAELDHVTLAIGSIMSSTSFVSDVVESSELQILLTKASVLECLLVAMPPDDSISLSETAESSVVIEGHKA